MVTSLTSKQILLLLGLPVAVYAYSLGGEFVYDDIPITVLQNPALTGEAGWLEVLAWSRPLREFTYMLDHALWGWQPFGYHLQNLIWHLANTFLLFGLLSTLGIQKPIGFFAALVFSIHPLQTESVAWVSGRKELLCLFFEIAACLLFVKALFSEHTSAAGRRLSYGGALMGLILALLSKQVAIMAPVLMLLCAWLYSRRHERPLPPGVWLRWLAAPLMVVLFFLLFRYDLARVFTQAQEHKVFFDPAARDVSFSLLSACLTPLATFAQSVRLFLFPLHLTVEHAFPPVTHIADWRWLAGLTLAAALALIAIRWRQVPELGFGLLWFVLSWTPVSGAVPVSYVFAERYLYIPSIGFCVLLAAGGHWLWRRFSARIGAAAYPRARWAFTAVLTLSLTLLAARTFDRTLDWRHEVALWQSAVAQNPDSALLQMYLGNAYLREENYERAMTAWDKAMALNPKLPQLWVNRGNALKQMGQWEEAKRSYQTALELYPQYGMAHYNLGLLYKEREDYQQALNHFQQAAKHIYGRRNQNRRQGMAHYHIAHLHYLAGRIAPAQAHIQQALRLAPRVVEAHILHGWIQQNHPQLAKRAFEKAIALAPQSAKPYFNYGLWHWQKGDPSQAQRLWKRAVQLEADYAEQIQAAKAAEHP